MLISKWGECVQGLTYIFPKQTVPVLNHPHPEEALFCNMTWFPFLGLPTVASCVCPILSMGNAISSRRQSSAHELELPSCISCLSTCKDIQLTVLPRLNLSSLLLLLLRRNKWITCRNSAACLCTRFLYVYHGSKGLKQITGSFLSFPTSTSPVKSESAMSVPVLKDIRDSFVAFTNIHWDNGSTALPTVQQVLCLHWVFVNEDVSGRKGNVWLRVE